MQNGGCDIPQGIFLTEKQTQNVSLFPCQHFLRYRIGRRNECRRRRVVCAKGESRAEDSWVKDVIQVIFVVQRSEAELFFEVPSLSS